MDERINCLTPWDVQSRQIFTTDGPWMTLYAGEGGGRGYVVYSIDCRNIEMNDEKSGTLQAKENGGYSLNYTNPVVYALEGNGIRPSHKGSGYSEEGKMFTLNTIEKHTVCYGISSFASNSMLSDNPESGIYEAKTSRTLDLNGGNPACNQGGIMVVEPKVTGALCANSHPGSYTGQNAFNNMLPVIKTDKPERKYILRRLTPTECARLQGFPDWWTDGADGSDSNIYKMWGNGIALPCAADVIGRLARELDK